MPNGTLEWPWHPDDFPSSRSEAGHEPLEDTAYLAARCFRGQDGQRFLHYLRSLTLCRTLGPGAGDALLRHVEGQRQLVQHICNLVEKGRTNSTGPFPSGTDHGEPS